MMPRRTRWVVCCGLVALSIGASTPAILGAESQVSLRWALGAWSGDHGQPRSISRDTELASGTRLKFLVEPTSPSTVYLILLDNEQAIHVLYRESPTFHADAAGAPTYIPPGSQYFELENSAGVDTFFLLASAEPLATLDGLLERYAATEVDSERSGLAQSIVTELRREMRAHRQFARAVEKPAIIGGKTRDDSASLADAIDRLATEVQTEGFYAKTISIGHE